MESFKKDPSNSGFIHLQLNLSGLLLLIIGTVFAEYVYLNGFPIVFTAIGIASAILGASIILAPRYFVPKSVSLNMIRDSYANSEAILNQFPAIGSCKYKPPRDGMSFIQIPINGEVASGEIQKKFVTDLGTQKVITIYPPLSVDTLSKIPQKASIENALSFILRDHYEIVKSIKISESGGRITVQLNGYFTDDEYPLCKQVLGSEPTSITGCTLSYILNKPLTLVKEEYSKFVIRATFEKVDY